MPPAGPDARITSRLLLLEGACNCTARLLAAAGCTRCVDRDSMFRRSELGLLTACWQHKHGRVDADRLLFRRCSNEAGLRASMLLPLLPSELDAKARAADDQARLKHFKLM
jgi:hypothetical protein